MRPAHGNLDGAETVAPGEEQQLGVEAETLDALLLEQDAAGFAEEGLKAALGVHKRQKQTDADNFIENNSGEFAEGRLVDFDEAAVERARTDGDVRLGAGERGEQLVGLFDGRGKVGVAEENDAAAGLEGAATHAETFAAVDSVGDHAERRNFRHKRPGDFGGAVARAVVHNDHFREAIRGAQVFRDAAKRGRQAGLFVVRRDNEGKLWRSAGHSINGSRQPWRPTSGTNRHSSRTRWSVWPENL